MKLHLKCVIILTILLQVTMSLAKTVHPRMIMGYDSGELKRCKFKKPNNCITLSKLDSPVSSLAVAGEYVYVGQQSGELSRCSQFRSSNCTKFHQLDSEINAIAFSGVNIFVGTTEGITKCGLRKSESCKLYYASETPIYSLSAFGDRLYAGSDNSIMTCSLHVSSNCTEFTNTTSAVNAITAYGRHIYLGLKEGSVEICEKGDSTDCSTLFSTHTEINDIDMLDGNLQTSLKTGEILRFNFETENTTIVLPESSNQILSMSIVYDTKSLYRHYVGESDSCAWQFTSCPPYVVYYDVQSRSALELHVKDNKIYTAEGELFDSEESDFSHSGTKAIFVMDAEGRIFASTRHPIGLIHHSSLMSGKPAAAAGEIKASDGEILSISSCSGHYRPSIELTEQVLSSLKKQGYEKNVTLIDCFRRKNLLIDLDYKKTDLYYEAQYKKYSRKMEGIQGQKSKVYQTFKSDPINNFLGPYLF